MDRETELNIQDILIKYDLLSEKEAIAVRMETLSPGRNIKDIVVEKGLVSEDALFYAISTELNLPFITLEPDTIDKRLVKSLPRDILEKYKFLPLIELDNEVRVAVADPTGKEVMEAINSAFPGRSVSISMALPSGILDTIEAIFTEKNTERVSVAAPAIAIFYSALTNSVMKGSDMLYFESVDRYLRIRKKVKDRVIDPELHPVDYMEPVIKKIKEMFNIEHGNSGSIKTVIAGKEVFITANIIIADKKQGGVLKFRYTAKKVQLDKFPVPTECSGTLQNALSRGSGLVLITGKDKELRESFAHALLLESNPAKKKVIALFQEEDSLPDTECYVTESPAVMNSAVSALMEAGIHTLFLQDIRKEEINIYNILQLAENTLVIASISMPSGKDAISFIERKTPELSKENRCISVVAETHKDPVPCQYCTSAAHCTTGKGCRRCGYSGVRGYSEKIEVLTY